MKAKFISRALRMPRPPETFGWVIISHRTRWHRLSVSVLPQMNWRIFLSILSHTLTDVAARGGMETLRPALQRATYRDALKCFIEGYQEGIQQDMEKKEGTKSQEEKDVHKGPSWLARSNM